MSRLSSLFEEDIEMQDALEDLENLTDDSEDILLLDIEENYNNIKSNEVHLFTNEAVLVNKDGLTPDEEAQIAAAFLDDEISEKMLSPEEIDQLEKEFLEDDEIDDLVDDDEDY